MASEYHLSGVVPARALAEAEDRYDRAVAQRDAWIRRFNSIEHLIDFHRRDLLGHVGLDENETVVTASDRALWEGKERIMREVANGE